MRKMDLAIRNYLLYLISSEKRKAVWVDTGQEDGRQDYLCGSGACRGHWWKGAKDALKKAEERRWTE